MNQKAEGLTALQLLAAQLVLAVEHGAFRDWITVDEWQWMQGRLRRKYEAALFTLNAAPKVAAAATEIDHPAHHPLGDTLYSQAAADLRRLAKTPPLAACDDGKHPDQVRMDWLEVHGPQQFFQEYAARPEKIGYLGNTSKSPITYHADLRVAVDAAMANGKARG